MEERKSKIALNTGSAVPMADILAFAAKEYGPRTHQARAAFYQWAYAENPNATDGMDHMVLAVDEVGRVVGFVNRLPISWEVHGERMVIPAIGDFAVDPNHRRGGVGMRLALRSTSDLGHAFINGSNPNSSPLFRSLKYQEFGGASWHRAILHPVRGALRHARHRFMDASPPGHRFLTAKPMGAFFTSARPDAALLEKLAVFLNDDPAPVKPFWTPGTVAWRFFHPLGPQHLLIHPAPVNGSLRGAMLVSAGVHRGLNVCRLVAYRCPIAGQFQEMITVALAIARASGIDAFSAFTFDAAEAAVLTRAGMKPLRQVPGAFFFHKRRGDAEKFHGVLIQGAASDFGLESAGGVH